MKSIGNSVETQSFCMNTVKSYLIKEIQENSIEIQLKPNRNPVKL